MIVRDAISIWRTSAGITLVELLVAIALIGVVLTIAAPNFRTFLLNTRLTSQTNELVLALAYARSEAVKRNLHVTVCSRASNTACAASNIWDAGWMVFVDTNADGKIDAGEDVLQVRAALEGNNTLRTGSSRQRVTFNSSGFSPGFNATFRLCDIRGKNDARSIVVTNQGRVTSRTGATQCP